MQERMPDKRNKVGLGERGARLYRNLNALGAVAFIGLGLLAPPFAPAANVLAGIDVLQAAGGEVVYRAAKNQRRKRDR